MWECSTDDGAFWLHWWVVDVTFGGLELDPGEVSEARWVDTREFLSLEPTFAGDRKFFRDVLPTLG